VLAGCGSQGNTPLHIELRTRGLSKLPFVIAYDQGLYAKYGLDVELFMPKPEYEDGIEAKGGFLLRHGFAEPPRFDVIVDGGTPMILDRTTNAAAPREVIIASNDCVVRTHIIGRKGITSLDELEGGRIGISAHVRTTTAFVALMLAERMGWDPNQDISILRHGRDLDLLSSGAMDAIVANERIFAEAVEKGYPVLADTRSWNEAIVGNSIRATREWLDENPETARRFLQASIEGLALFHINPEVAMDVLVRWNGVPPENARAVYERGATFSKKPYPCYDGIENVMRLYDSHEMRRYQGSDFYDDILLRELDEEGFIDLLYE